MSETLERVQRGRAALERSRARAVDVRAWAWVALVVVTATVAKVVVSGDSPGPVLFADELIFSHYAWQLRDISYAPVPDIVFKATYVPPLYPLALVPATYFDSWYAFALVTNAAVSSLASVPIFALARRYVTPASALVVAAIAAIYPAQWIYSGLLMSENLFMLIGFTLFWAASEYFAVPTGRRVLRFGLMLGIAYLTRPIALGFLPVGMVLVTLVEVPPWRDLDLRRPRQLLRSFETAAKRVAQFLVGFAVPVLPWALYGLSIGDATGALGLRSSPAVGSPPVSNLGRWLVYYAAYLVVLGAAQGFGAIAAARANPRDPMARDRMKPLVLTAVLATLGLLIPAMRHSFRVYDQFGKLHGRYITYLFVILLLVGLAVVEHQQSTRTTTTDVRPGMVSWTALPAAALVAVLASMVLRSRDFMTMTNSPDGYAFVHVMGPWWVSLLAAVGVATILLAQRAAVAPARQAQFLAVLTLGAVVITSGALLASDPLQSNARARHARAVADVVASNPVPTSTVVFDTQASMTWNKIARLEEELQFWRLDQLTVTPLSEVTAPPDLSGLASLGSRTLVVTPRDLPFQPVSKYHFADETWWVYRAAADDFVGTASATAGGGR